MRRSFGKAGFLATALAFASMAQAAEETYTIKSNSLGSIGYNPILTASMSYSGDPRKAARNHHRRMKASGRHNWKKSI